MSNVAVSVIIPMHNASKYIEKTMRSIINQDFNDFEIVIVDDGSDDDSLNIVKNFLINEPIPHIIESQKNSGVSSARNKGIKLSNGEYIIFVDDDDYISPKHISNLYNKIIDEKTDFSFSYLAKTDENGDILTSMDSYNAILDNSLTSKDLIKLEMLMEIPFYFVQIMYKKEIIERYNIEFDESKIYGEDTEFALKVLTHAENIGISKEFSYFYIQRAGSATSDTYLNRFSFVDTLEDFSKYYSKNSKNRDDIFEINELIFKNRIPKAIFGNLMFLFYEDYSYDIIMDKVNELGLLEKLKHFKVYTKKDRNFNFKTKLFLISPKMYYRFWKRFKNKI